MIERFFQYSIKRGRHLSNFYFIVEMLILSFLMKIPAGLFLALFHSDDFQTTTDILVEHNSPMELWIAACVIAPIIETITGQWLPMLLIRLFTSRATWPVIGSALCFALMHVYAGFPSVLIMFCTGLVFALGFFIQWQQSWWKAFWITSTVHAVHNFIAFLLYLIV